APVLFVARLDVTVYVDCFFFYCYLSHSALPSFPTRRSSDLTRQGRGFLPAGLVEEIRAVSRPPIPWDVELARWFDEQFAPMEKRSEEHTSELQSRFDLVCRLLLEKKKKKKKMHMESSLQRYK